jgi:hypothetical protein
LIPHYAYGSIIPIAVEFTEDGAPVNPASVTLEIISERNPESGYFEVSSGFVIGATGAYSYDLDSGDERIVEGRVFYRWVTTQPQIVEEGVVVIDATPFANR